MSANSLKNGLIYDPGTCRCCGASKKCRLLNLEYEYQKKKEIYSDMFVECFGLVLSHLDGEPSDRLICATCVSRLREACLFRKQVLDWEEKLLQARIHVHDASDLPCGPAPMEIKTEIIKEDVSDDDDIAYYDDRNNDDVTNIGDSTAVPTEKSTFRNSDELCKSKSFEKSTEDRLQNDLLLKIQKMKKRLKLIQGTKHKTLTQIKRPSPPAPPASKYVDEDSLAFQNMLVIVENSYVCPFQTAYSSYHCVYCSRTFREPDRFRLHATTHDPKRLRLFASTRPTYLDIHRTDCRLCSDKINSFDELKTHLKDTHKLPLHSVKENILTFNLTNGPLTCTQCETSFLFFHALKRHMAVHFGTFVCEMCGEHYFDKRSLEQHCRGHRSETKFACHQCGKVFKRQQALSMHLSCVHKKEPAFQCIKCDESLYSAQDRYKHMRDAHGETNLHSCEKCGKAYNSRSYLLEHNRTVHLRVYKHRCAQCHRGFSHPHRLAEHVASMHRTEAQFFCDICGNSYPRLHFLKLHIQSHANDTAT